MIRLKNRAEEFETLSAPGVQAASANAIQTTLCPYVNAYVKAVIARVRTAGTTGTQTVELRKNGTAIGGGGVATFTFASTATVPTYGVGTVQVTATKGDTFSIVNTAVHTTPAVDLSVIITFGRVREVFPGDGGPPQTETVLGIDADLYS